jgi:outer membrane biosynthesis protein TonB
MSEEFDPYLKWLGISPQDQPPNHYRLLGIDPFMEDPDVIESAADQRMTHIRGMSTGSRGVTAQQILNELSAAKLCLLDPPQKTHYDGELRQEHHAAASNLQVATVIPVLEAEPEIADVAVTTSTTASRRAGGQRRNSSNLIIAGALTAAIILAVIVGYALMPGGTEQPVNPPPSLAQKTQKVASPPPEPPQRAAASKTKVSQKPKLPTNPKPKAAPAKKKQEPKPKVDPPPPQVEIAESQPSRPVPAKEVRPSVGNKNTDTRHPIPDVVALAGAQKLVDEVFGKRLAKTSSREDRISAAKKLLTASQDSANEPAVKFSLLNSAHQLAIDAADVDLIDQTAARMAAEFRVDPIKKKASAYYRAGKGRHKKEGCAALTRAMLNLADEAVTADRIKLAETLGKVVTEVARKSKDRELIGVASAIAKELRQLAKQMRDAEKDRAALQANPEDADAHLRLGQYLCYVRDDWKKGLPHLAKGSNTILKAAAALDLAGGRDAKQQVAIADAWWNSAEEDRTETKADKQLRAAFWYKKALPQLAGLPKAKVEQRLAKLDRLGTPGKRRPGAKKHSLAGKPVSNRARRKKIEAALGYRLRKHPSGAVELKGHWYAALPAGKTWAEARDYCRQVGGYLICINSEK